MGPRARFLAAAAVLCSARPAAAVGTGITYVNSESYVVTTDSGGSATIVPNIPVAAGGTGNHLVIGLAVLGSSATVSSVTYQSMAMTRLVSRTTSNACGAELWELPLAAPDGAPHDIDLRTSAGGVVVASTYAQFRGVRARVSPALVGSATGSSSPATVTIAAGAGQFTVGAACNRGASSQVAMPVSPSQGFITIVKFVDLSLGTLRAETGAMASQTMSWTVTGTSQGWATVAAALPGDPPATTDAGVDATADALPLDAGPEAMADAPGGLDSAPDASVPDQGAEDGGTSIDAGAPGVDAPPRADAAGAVSRAVDLRVGCACRAAGRPETPRFPLALLALAPCLRRRRRQGGVRV